jgi:hypothetical protein
LMSCENTLLKKRNTLAKMLKRTVLSEGWNPQLGVTFDLCTMDP